MRLRTACMTLALSASTIAAEYPAHRCTEGKCTRYTVTLALSRGGEPAKPLVGYVYSDTLVITGHTEPGDKVAFNGKPGQVFQGDPEYYLMVYQFPPGCLPTVTPDGSDEEIILAKGVRVHSHFLARDGSLESLNHLVIAAGDDKISINPPVSPAELFAPFFTADGGFIGLGVHVSLPLPRILLLPRQSIIEFLPKEWQ